MGERTRVHVQARADVSPGVVEPERTQVCAVHKGLRHQALVIEVERARDPKVGRI